MSRAFVSMANDAEREREREREGREVTIDCVAVEEERLVCLI